MRRGRRVRTVVYMAAVAVATVAVYGGCNRRKDSLLRLLRRMRGVYGMVIANAMRALVAHHRGVHPMVLLAVFFGVFVRD